MILEFDSVTKAYAQAGRRVVALADVSLEIGRGEFAALYGPSRSGKTTLLRLAAGLDTPDSGSVTYWGMRLDRMSDRDRTRYRREEVGSVWRTPPSLPGLNVLDTVAFGHLLQSRDRTEARRRAKRLLDVFGAHHCAEASPQELSDGERQRVALAQALVNDPPLLIADEPTMNLGPVERDSILELFQVLATEKKMAVLVTGTNALEVLRANPIFGIEAGKLIGVQRPAPTGEIIELPKERLV